MQPFPCQHSSVIAKDIKANNLIFNFTTTLKKPWLERGDTEGFTLFTLLIDENLSKTQVIETIYSTENLSNSN
ncbi:MAG: hypothetical protein D6822_01655 [Cyanobacteria bacterium J149]|nr:MAG: hypothetical protein D6822_01655 [Cyanobacteria bacterium J149]